MACPSSVDLSMTVSRHWKYELSLTGSLGVSRRVDAACISLSALSHSFCPGAAVVHVSTDITHVSTSC